jgi:hypothetical protein
MAAEAPGTIVDGIEIYLWPFRGHRPLAFSKSVKLDKNRHCDNP